MKGFLIGNPFCLYVNRNAREVLESKIEEKNMLDRNFSQVGLIIKKSTEDMIWSCLLQNR